jgi:predicted transcriptional regulator
MNEQPTIPAKATTPAEQSDSIVVSFGAEWHPHLLSKAFSVVIRKRIPKSSSFEWLYFHVNSPFSALCGRAKIEKIFSATEKEAVALAKDIHLSPAEVKSYIGGANKIGCYKLGAFEFGMEPITIARLCSRIEYHPPQSFFILSRQAKEIIDRFAGFKSITVKKLKKKDKS